MDLKLKIYALINEVTANIFLKNQNSTEEG